MKNNEKYEKALNKIKSELSEINSIPPRISEQKAKLENDLMGLRKAYEEENSKYIKMKRTYGNIISQEAKKEKLLVLRSKIQSTQDVLNDFQVFNNKEKENLLQEQRDIISQLADFDFSATLKQVEVWVSKYINEVINNTGLELEKSLGQANLFFDIDEFSLYQKLNSKKIYLSEMGSGSNWLNCHIALMLGLHKYIALNNSKIPSFIFFDQPSQVYFPSEEDIKKDNKPTKEQNKVASDLTTVANVFKSIINNVENINSDPNVTSKVQLFITDHYHTNDEWFKKYVIKDGEWVDGKKLIPIELL